MVMTNKAILKAIKDKRIIIDNFSKSCLFPTSYNLRAGKILLYSKDGFSKIDLEKKKFIIIEPKTYIICKSLEKFKVDDSVHGILGGKSDLINKGLIIVNGLTIDPTFEGYLEFGLFNALDVKIKLSYKEKISKVVFFDIPDLKYEKKWLPKTELRKWQSRNLNKFTLKEMNEKLYQGG